MKSLFTGTYLYGTLCFWVMFCFPFKRSPAFPKDIPSIVYAAGDYRPRIPNTDLSSDGDWLVYNGTAWVTAPTAPEHLLPAARPQRILIDVPGITAGDHTAHTYNDFIILYGGELLFTTDAVLPLTTPFLNDGKSIEVQSGGKCFIRGDVALPADGRLFLLNGAELTVDQATFSNAHPLWNGIECFEAGSTVVIRNWNWSSSLLGSVVQISANVHGYCFGHLKIEAAPTVHWNLIEAASGRIDLAEGDLDILNTSAYYITGTNASGSVSGYVVNGHCLIRDGAFAFGASQSAGFIQHQILLRGGLTCLSNDPLKTHVNLGAAASDMNSELTIQSSISIASGIPFWGGDASLTGKFMTLYLEGGTAAAPLFLRVAPVLTGVPVVVRAGAFVRLLDQSLTLNSLTGLTSRFIVESGAVFHFGWAADGLTPLVIRRTSSGAMGTNQFLSQSGSELFITSPDGLQQTSSSGGNVQLSTTNKSFSQTALFHYVGRQDQQTGDAITSVGSARVLICELQSNALKLTLTNSTSITAPGYLDLRSGQFLETETAMITGSTGGLTMASGTLYQIPSLSAHATDYLPRLTGTGNVYTLSGGTIELNGSGEQIVRGSRNYRNLTFSGSGTKSISSAIPDILGTVSLLHSVVLNVNQFTLGGAGTHLFMSGNSRYITAGTGTKPDAQESYSLGMGTTIEFSNMQTTRQDVRLSPLYANIDISGSNVGNGSLVSTPVFMQTGSVFTIKTGGVFKFFNQNGFCGGPFTAISAINNPLVQLETGSTVDYAGTGSGVLTARNDYKNLTISGGGSYTLNGAVFMSGQLRLQAGFVHTSTTASLTLTASASCPAGGSASSFVNGPLVKEGQADFVFPIGDYTPSLQQYAPIALSGLTTATVFTAQFYKGNAHLIGPITAPGLQRVSFCEYWSLTQTGTAQANVTLSWSASSKCNAGSYVTDIATLVAAHSNGQGLVNNSGAWIDYGMNLVNGNPTAGTLTRASVVQFGLFALGTTSVAQNPLPNETAFLQGTTLASGTQLKGSLQSCSHCTPVHLERSRNGLQFSAFTPASFFYEQESGRFTAVDSFLQEGPVYYRFGWSRGGQIFYSNIVCVRQRQPFSILMHGGPAGAQLLLHEIRRNSVRRIRIVNQMGSVLKEIIPQTDPVLLPFDFYPSGMYWVQVLTDEGRIMHPVWKQ